MTLRCQALFRGHLCLSGLCSSWEQGRHRVFWEPRYSAEPGPEGVTDAGGVWLHR